MLTMKRCISVLLVMCLIAGHLPVVTSALASKLEPLNAPPSVVSVSSIADPSEGMFTSNTALTRGMFFYALWKHCGSPEPDVTERPYTDLDESDYYYDAVYWAVGAYITNGISTYEFNPDGYVLRGNAATFLYRALVGNNPAKNAGCPFTDVDEWDFYYEAVCWASENGLMTSLDEEGLFQPYETCYYGDIYWDGSAPSVSNRQPDINFEYVVYEDHVEITGCNSYATDIVIPATIEGLPVTSIGDKAFYDFYWLSSISIPDSVNFIGDCAFAYCSTLTSISIPYGVTSIGDSTFYFCRSLTNITIPDSLSTIGNRAFYYCSSLPSISIPDSVILIGDEAFSGCSSLTNISIPAGITHINDNTFSFCDSLTSIYIPDSVTSIGYGAFSWCSNLSSISIPAGVTTIGGAAFYGCSSLTSIHIPKGVTAIGNSTFSQCTNLSSIAIPDGVTKIGHYAFASCESLTDITIPDGVTFIGECAFEFCNSLTSITIPSSVTILIDGALSRCSNLTSIYFKGDAPEFDLEHMGGVFYNVTATAYYPAGNPTWTADMLQDYGGDITWVSYTDLNSTPNNGTYSSPQESAWYDIWRAGTSKSNTARNFNLNVGDQIYPTGDSWRARADIPFELSHQVSISKDGWITCQIPQELVYTCREIVLYPDTKKEPFAQFIVARKNGDSIYVNLSCSHLSVYENAIRTYDMFVDINWNGHSPGKIYLKQGNLTLDLKEGKNQGLLLGMFSASGDDLKLCWETADGVVYSQKTYLFVYKNSTSGIKIDGGESTSGTNKASEKDDEMWGGMSFAIDIFNDLVPVELDMNPTSLNKGTFKGTLGLKFENADNKKTIIDLLETNLNANWKYTTFDSLKDTLKAKYPETLIPQQATAFVISADTQLLGFIEGTYELGTDGSLINIELMDSKILAAIDGKYSRTRQHIVSPAPWYWTLEVEAGIELALELQNKFDGTSASLAPLNSEIEVGLGAKAAVGVSGAASVGVKGGGKIHVAGQALPIDFSKTEVYSDYEIALCGELGPFMVEAFRYESDKFYIWKNGKWVFSTDPSGNSKSLDAIPNVGFEMQQIPRDYLKDARSMQLNSITDAVAENLIKANTYTFTEPQIVQLDNGNFLLVWVDDPGVAVRPVDINRAALFYSVYDGRTWSEPVMVSDDGTADSSPVLKSIDGNVYLLWNNANAVLDASAGYSEYCAALDIAYARFDSASGVFTDVSVVDTNNYCDVLPDMTLVNGVPTVVWIQNSANDPFQLSGSNKLYATTLTSGNWNATVLADALTIVDDLAAGVSDDALSVYISQDTDSDVATVEDRELFRVTSNGISQITDNIVADLKPTLIGESLYWYQNGMLTDGTKNVPLAEDTDRYVTVENGTDAAVLYQKYNEDDSVSICVNMLHNGTWTNEIELVTIDRYLPNFDAVISNDGSITIITNEVVLDDNDYQQANLCSYTFGQECDITVQQISLNPLSMAPGGEMELFATIKNIGTAEAGELCAQIYDGESLLKEEMLSIELDMGMEATMILTYPLEEGFAPETLRVEFWPVNGTDGNENNNAADCSISYADVSVEELTAIRGEGTTQISAYISNRGLTELSDVEVVLYTKTGDEQTIIDCQAIPSLAVAMGEAVTFDVAYDVDTVVYVEAIVSDEEFNLSNNDKFTLVSAVSAVLDADCHDHVFSNYVSDSNATCTKDGTKTAKCDHCDLTSTIPDVGSALGHAFGAWTVIQEPTASSEGIEEHTCTRCGHSEQRGIAKLENPFNDVASGSFYYEPVMWAIENGITNGTSATTFGPNDQCMRAHVVTFLWRAVGCPEPIRTDNPFVDVKPTDFYYKPVLWALENGITSGMDATHFGPTAYCNRAQVVTFLYRTVGSPAVDASQNPFADVPVGQWFTAPVLWAVENGITNGLSATSFGPNSICNRAQIVTFLYRAFN